MHIGLIGLGRMGGNMVRRLTKGGHKVTGFRCERRERQESWWKKATKAHPRLRIW